MNFWLVQRLEKPLGFIDPFGEFGAGNVHNGGFRHEDLNALRRLFSFDYMGDAEYEWGAVSDAISAIWDYAAAETLCAFSTITAHGIVYALTNSADAEQAAEAIACWARNRWTDLCEHDDEHGQPIHRLLDPPYLWEQLVEPHERWGRYVGGLDCNNNFLFFTNPEVFYNTARFFGINIPEMVIPE